MRDGRRFKLALLSLGRVLQCDGSLDENDLEAGLGACSDVTASEQLEGQLLKPSQSNHGTASAEGHVLHVSQPDPWSVAEGTAAATSPWQDGKPLLCLPL